MVNSLLAIAAFVTLVGGVIFGVSRFEKKSEQQEEIELITKPSGPLEQLVTLEEISQTAETTESDSQVAAIEIPNETEVEEAQSVLDLGEISQAESVEDAAERQAVNPMEDQALDQSVLEVAEPRAEIEEVVIPATIQDPKRPSDAVLEDLTQDILAWGQSKELKQIPKLIQYATNSDSVVRENVAIALGQIASSHPVRGDVDRAIPILGKLAQDSNLQVRQFAVQALGSIRSEKVLPYLQQALLSPSGSVKKAANDALQNLKFYYGQTPAMQQAQKAMQSIKAEKTVKA